MKKDSLTKQKKRSIIWTSSARSFDRVFIKVKTKMKTLYKDSTDWWVRRKVRQTLCYFVSFFNWRETMSTKTLKKIYGLIAIVMLAILAACGGGGGGSAPTTTCPTGYTLANGVCNPPTPITVTETVTCPDGTSQTATASTAALALDAATAACPGINATKVVVTPADKATGVSPDTIATNGIVVATSSTLTTPAISDITLKAGTVAVPVTVTMTAGSKGFTLIPSAKLLYAQVYSGIVNLTDTLGKKLAVPFSFTTSSCQLPLVSDASGTSCIQPTCPAGQMDVGGVCTDPTFHYSEFKLVVFANEGGTLGRITTGADGLPNSVVPLINNSGFTTGAAFPLALCGIWDKLLADGRPLASCQTPAVGNTRRNFPINPVTGSVEAEWTGAVPAGAVLHDVPYNTGVNPYVSHGIGYVGSYLKVTGGVIYFSVTEKKMYFVKAADMAAVDWATVSNVLATGDYQYLVMFSN